MELVTFKFLGMFFIVQKKNRYAMIKVPISVNLDKRALFETLFVHELIIRLLSIADRIGIRPHTAPSAKFEFQKYF